MWSNLCNVALVISLRSNDELLMILSQTKAGKSKICFGTGVLTCLDLKQMRQSEGVW